MMDILAELHRQHADAMGWVMRRRSEVLAAFVAKYGCEADEIIQIEQVSEDGRTRTWRVDFAKNWPLHVQMEPME